MKQARAAVASKEDIRRNNLSAVLRLVHTERAISRATVGDVLGLSKTTIAELVSELEHIGLVVRMGNEQSGSAGRPSHIVAASPKPIVLVVNPEVDGVIIALVNFHAEIVEMEYVPLDVAYSVETTTTLVADYVKNHRKAIGARLYGGVLALPGAIDATTHKLINAPSLGWTDIDVAQHFAKALAIPFWAINNARAATTSEHLFGAAKGISNAICLFSGVGGIGGGFIVNDHVLEGSNGLAGEIGKIRLYPEGPKKHLTFGELMHREDLVHALGKTRLSDESLDDLVSVTQDTAVHKVIDAQVSVLVTALETLRDLFDPQAILLGGYLGSLAKSRRLQMSKSLNQHSLKQRDDNFLIPRAVELRPMVLLGAAELAWADVLRDPMSFKAKKGKRNG